MTKSKQFIIGFLAGLAIFIAFNIYTYDDGFGGSSSQNGVRATECFDCLKQFGWPFRLHQSGTILHIDEFLWSVRITAKMNSDFGGKALPHFWCKAEGKRL